MISAVWLTVQHGKNFNTAIFLDTVNVINVKHCMMVLSDLDHISSSQLSQTVVTENFVFLSMLKLHRIDK